MKLSQLFSRARLSFPEELGDINLSGIETDSRRVSPNCLFLCIRGLHADGHEFVSEALEKGAAVIVAEKVHDACAGGAATVLVEDTRRAASLLYHAWYGNPAEHMKLIGVTGTNGKTSVSFMLTAILEEAGHPCGLIGTVCCTSPGGRRLATHPENETANMTTPDPSELFRLLAEMRADGAEFVVMEVTSHALALRKIEGLTFEIGVFTNLTQDHLDFHSDMESYFCEKAKLFDVCKRALICVDDPYGRRLFKQLKCPSVSCSRSSEENAGAFASDIRYYGMRGCSYLWHFGREESRVFLPLAGTFAVMNSLEAATAARLLGLSPRQILCALRYMKQVPGRMELVPLGGAADFRVLIDYAHTPDALEKLLKSLISAKHGKERILLLFGCGGERDRSKRREMAHIASRLSDFVILTSDNARNENPKAILVDIQRGMDKEKPYVVIEDRREAIRFGVSLCRTGDILVLAGKGHETYEINRTGKHPFDEKQIVMEALVDMGQPKGQ